MRPIAAFASIGMTLLSSAAMAAEQKEGMPQLDFANPLMLAQVVWLAVIFLALYLLLSRWALPQVAGVLEARAVAIGNDLEAARRAKGEADAAVAELTAATREAQATAQAEIATAVAQAKEAAARRSAALTEKLDAQLVAAEQRISAARSAALGALRQVAAETTEVLVTRLTGIAPGAGAADQAVAAVMAERGR